MSIVIKNFCNMQRRVLVLHFCQQQLESSVSHLQVIMGKASLKF